MKSKYKLKMLAVISLLSLAGCGGGGGGSSGAAGPTPFSAWSSVGPNSRISASGGGTTMVNGVPTQSYNGGARVVASFDNNRNLSSLEMNANGVSGNFSTARGDVLRVNTAAQEFTSRDGLSVATFFNPYAFGWEYQTFGVWGGSGSNLSTVSVNSVSVGSLTPTTGIPASGQATFSGISGGYFVSASGGLYAVAAPSALSVNFGNRVFGFATSGTVATPVLGTGALINAPLLNMSGAGSYTAGTNQLAGTVTTSGGMSGPIIAQFYGPNANEVGGSYAVRNSSIGAMTGAFGGKR